MKWLFLVAGTVMMHGQTAVDLRSQSKNIDFSSALSTRPAKTGASLPATCSVGEAFFSTSAAAGSNWYGCTSANVWTPQGAPSQGGFGGCEITASTMAVTVAAPCRVALGAVVFNISDNAVATISGPGSGSAYIYWDANGRLVVDEDTVATFTCNGNCVTASTGGFPATSIPLAVVSFTNGAIGAPLADKRAVYSTRNVVCGSGLVCTTNGANGEVEVSTDGGAATASLVQSGSLQLCSGASGSDAYTCVMQPGLTGYTIGQVVQFLPDVSNQGAATLNINGVGVKSIRKADGISDPQDNTLLAGRQIALAYDGSGFRLPAGVGDGVVSVRGLWSGRPSCSSGNVGQTYYSTDGNGLVSQCDGSSWADYYSSIAIQRPPAAVGYVVANGGAVNDAAGTVTFSKGTAGFGVALLPIATPSANWDLQMAFGANIWKSLQECGIAVSNGTAAGTSKLSAFLIGANASGGLSASVRTFDPISAAGSDEGLVASPVLRMSPLAWMRVTKDGSNNLTFFLGDSGQWTQVHTLSFGAQPSHFGFGCDPQGFDGVSMRVWHLNIQ